ASDSAEGRPARSSAGRAARLGATGAASRPSQYLRARNGRPAIRADVPDAGPHPVAAARVPPLAARQDRLPEGPLVDVVAAQAVGAAPPSPRRHPLRAARLPRSTVQP